LTGIQVNELYYLSAIYYRVCLWVGHPSWDD